MAVLRAKDWMRLIKLTHDEYRRATKEKRDARKERSLWLRLMAHVTENDLGHEKRSLRRKPENQPQLFEEKGGERNVEEASEKDDHIGSGDGV